MGKTPMPSHTTSCSVTLRHHWDISHYSAATTHTFWCTCKHGKYHTGNKLICNTLCTDLYNTTGVQQISQADVGLPEPQTTNNRMKVEKMKKEISGTTTIQIFRGEYLKSPAQPPPYNVPKETLETPSKATPISPKGPFQAYYERGICSQKSKHKAQNYKLAHQQGKLRHNWSTKVPWNYCHREYHHQGLQSTSKITPEPGPSFSSVLSSDAASTLGRVASFILYLAPLHQNQDLPSSLGLHCLKLSSQPKITNKHQSATFRICVLAHKLSEPKTPVVPNNQQAKRMDNPNH